LKKTLIALNIIITLLLITLVVLTMVQILGTSESITDIEARYLFIMSGLLLLVSINMTDLAKKLFIRMKRIFIVFSLLCMILSIIKFVTMHPNDEIALWLNIQLSDDALIWLAAIALIFAVITVVVEFARIFRGNKVKPEKKDEIVEHEEQEVQVINEEQEKQAAEENEKLD
jgi:lysylphosphatidylglycerol synthetase-like protein (DUF2156 family)